jgi:hypothetical protein
MKGRRIGTFGAVNQATARRRLLPIHKDVLRWQIQIQLESELYNLLHDFQLVEMAPYLCGLWDGVLTRFEKRPVQVACLTLSEGSSGDYKLASAFSR